MEPIYIKNFLPEVLLNFIYSYCVIHYSSPSSVKIDVMDFQTNSLISRYSDPVMETLMDMSTPVIEQNLNKKLFPTNSFFRIYDKGATLPIHIDRTAAEYTVALCIGADPVDMPYEIFVGEKDNTSDYKFFYDRDHHTDLDMAGKFGRTKITHKFSMLPNDALIFKGSEKLHWREYCEHDHYVTVFLHYVDQDGPFKDYKFDKREGLGYPILIKNN